LFIFRANCYFQGKLLFSGQIFSAPPVKRLPVRLCGCWLEVCGCGAEAGKISEIPAGAGRGGFRFCGCGAGADENFNPRRTLVGIPT